MKRCESLIRVFIDQGHNPERVNAGAEGFGLREQDITFMVGIYLANILESDGRFSVRTSRTYPEEILGYDNRSSLQARVNAANSWPADFFISIHVNANVNPAVNGSEVYVYEAYTQSYFLGQDILAEIVRRLGTKYNGVWERPSLYVLRNTDMTSVLVELAYISNAEDAEKLRNDQYQFAYAIYVGLLNYLGLEQVLF